MHKNDMLLLYVTFVIWVTREDDARHLLPLGGLSKMLPVTFVICDGPHLWPVTYKFDIGDGQH